MRTRLVVLAFVSLSVATAATQSNPPASHSSPPAHGLDAGVVRLDMFVAIDGRPVDDLARADIEVREDGVVQTVDAFTFVRAGGARPHAGAAPAGGGVPEGAPRRLVVFLDTYHLVAAQSETMRDRLADRLDAAVGPTDEVALVGPETDFRALGFLAKDMALARIREASWWTLPPLPDATDVRYEECFSGSTSGANAADSPSAEMTARRRESATLDALERLAARVALAVTARTPVLLVTDGWRLFRPNPELGRRPSGRQSLLRGLAGGGSPARRDRRSAAMSSNGSDCEADLSSLAALDHSTRITELGERASRALLSFYPLTSRALVPEASGPQVGGKATVGEEAVGAARADSLRLLAEQTGGTAAVDDTRADRLWGALVADGSYYLLAYAPTNGRLDGRFRDVTVTVARPGARVRTRRGYRGLSVGDLFGDTQSPSRRGDPTDVGGRGPAALRPLFRIRPSSWAYRRDDRVEGGFWIVGELDYRLRNELVWSAGAEAEVTVLASDGSDVLSRTVAVSAASGGFGLRVPEDTQLPPGDYAVRVRVRPPGADDMALTDTARVVVPAATSDLGEAVMWRRGPSTGPLFVMTADARFRRRDKLRLELPADTMGTATARMLDRMRQPIRVPVTVGDRVDARNGMRWIVAETTLAPLASGDYAIEVEVEGYRRVTTFQVVP